METEVQKAYWVKQVRKSFLTCLSGIEWAEGGWRGNGDDASPSAFRNASSGVAGAHPDDPLVKWADDLWEKVVRAVGFEFVAAQGPTKALAQFLQVPRARMQYVLQAISGRFVPEIPEEMVIYERLAPPPPFTEEQRREAMLRWRAETKYRGFLTTHENPYWFNEEVLLAELNRLRKVFPSEASK